MKVLLCVYGQARFSNLGAATFLKLLSNRGDSVRVVVHSWDKSVYNGIAAPWVDESKLTICSKTEILNILDPVASIFPKQELPNAAFLEAVPENYRKDSTTFSLYQIAAGFSAVIVEAARQIEREGEFSCVIFARHDFRPQTWRVRDVRVGSVAYPNLLTLSDDLCDWAFCLNPSDVMRLAKEPSFLQRLPLIVERTRSIKGERCLRAYFEDAGLDTEGFTAGGFLVRDGNLSIKWGQPDPIEEKFAFLRHLFEVATQRALDWLVRKIRSMKMGERLLERIRP